MSGNREAPPFAGRTVAVSISESEDLDRLGLMRRDLDRTLDELATALVYRGARVAYGGDLREGGYTHRLFQRIADAYAAQRPGQEAPPLPFIHYVAVPVWRAWSAEQLFRHAQSNGFLGEIRLCLPSGDWWGVTADEGHLYVSRPGTAAEETIAAPDELEELWRPAASGEGPPAEGLTRMRRTMAREADARVVLGGKVKGYQGSAPGIGEEALRTLEERRWLIPLGGFGGCARDVAIALRLLPDSERLAHKEVGQGYAECMERIAAQGERYFPAIREAGLVEEHRHAAWSDLPTELADLCVRILLRVLLPSKGPERDGR